MSLSWNVCIVYKLIKLLVPLKLLKIRYLDIVCIEKDTVMIEDEQQGMCDRVIC